MHTPYADMSMNITLSFVIHMCPRMFSATHTVLCRYVALEDFENGIKCYHSALRVDSRHYNAWYGLGMLYLRQEKYEFSEHHFHMAYQINPRSSVILSYLGTALHALKVNNLVPLVVVVQYTNYNCICLLLVFLYPGF